METLREYEERTFSSLKVYNYRLYFIGQAISLCGSWMQTIGQAWLVLQLTGSGTALGVVTALQFLPILLFGPWAGLIVDRFPKRRILFLTQFLQALLALLLGLLITIGNIHLWQVYVFALILGMVIAVDNPVRQTFVLEMVGKGKLTNAIMLNSSEINLTRAIGPMIGGILIAQVGIAWCFTINGVSFLAVMVALLLMHDRELHVAPLVQKEKGQLKEGLLYAWRTPILRATLMIMALIGAFSFEFPIVLPLLSKFTFQRGADGYASLMAVMGIGAMVGGLTMAQQKRSSFQTVVGSGYLFGLALLAAAVAPTFFVLTILLIVVGFFSVVVTAAANIIIQLTSDPHLRGRMMALLATAFFGSTLIGGPVIGWISEAWGPRWGLAIGGMVAIAAAVCGVRIVHPRYTPYIKE